MAAERLAVVAAPLVAALVASGCARASDPAANNQAAAAVTLPEAEPTPAERAQLLVRRQVGDVSFGDAQVFTSAGATIVCGRYQQPGQAPARYIAVGEDDVFVEGRMQDGHMDRAVTEFCRNA